MRTEIVKPKARIRLDELCRIKNSSSPVITITRNINGSEQVYERRTKAVSDGAQNTGKLLIMLYAGHYRKQMEMLGDSIFSDGSVPSLPLNNVRVANFRELSDRTIRRHIKELKDIGFITSYKFHGSKKDFEVWLDEKVLFGVNSTSMPAFSEASDTSLPQYPNSFKTAQDRVFEKANRATAPSENATKCPHKPTIETNGNKTNTIIKVEKSKHLWKHLDGNTDSTAQELPNGANGNQMGGAAARGGNVDKYVDKSDKKCVKAHGGDFEGLHRYFRAAVVDFWKYAKKSLWSDIIFSETEWLKIADEITNNVYKPFIGRRPGEREFMEYHHELIKSIDVARKYFEAHPERYPAFPYAKTDTLLGYFDLKNKRGFSVAVSWRFKNRAAQEEQEAERVVRMAILHLKKHKAGVAPKRLQVKPYREVVNFYLIKLKNYSKEHQENYLRKLMAINSEVSFGRSRRIGDTMNALKDQMLGFDE